MTETQSDPQTDQLPDSLALRKEFRLLARQFSDLQAKVNLLIPEDERRLLRSYEEFRRGIMAELKKTQNDR